MSRVETERNALLDSVVRSMVAEPDYFNDVAGRCVGTSPRVQALLMRSPEEMAAADWHAIVDGFPHDEFVRAIRERRLWTAEYRVLRGDGRWIRCRGITWPVYDGEGKHLGSAGRLFPLKPDLSGQVAC